MEDDNIDYIFRLLEILFIIMDEDIGGLFLKVDA